MYFQFKCTPFAAKWATFSCYIVISYYYISIIIDAVKSTINLLQKCKCIHFLYCYLIYCLTVCIKLYVFISDFQIFNRKVTTFHYYLSVSS